jgi:hypothetical protein
VSEDPEPTPAPLQSLTGLATLAAAKPSPPEQET